MAAATTLDTTFRLLEIAGEAKDAVSAYTQVLMKEGPKLF